MMKALLLAAVYLSLAIASAASRADVRVLVKGMVCSFCAQAIEKNLKRENVVDAVKVDLGKHLVTITLKDGQAISDEKLVEIFTDSGFKDVEIKR
jgi:copper chaperone CopZ